METPAPVTIPVAIGDGYPVLIGAGLLGAAAELIEERQIAIITDERVESLYGAALQRVLAGDGRRVRLYAVPGGESSKSVATFEGLLRAMVRDDFDRGAAVVALGGGVIGDLAGYCAASFLRGVRFYQLPTSLLAMVDASIGGKTGLNLPEGKNLLGAFWQPERVIADVATLASLPPAELRQGAVEAYKHGLLADRELWRAVGAGRLSPGATPAELTELVARAVRVKAEVVAADSFERGLRAHLNLGHTLGHALEIASDHRLAHGEAVAYGLLYAAHLARDRGWTDLCGEVRAFVAWVDPGTLPDTDFDELLALMARDKKRRDGRVRFVLLRDVAQPTLVDDLEREALRRAWNALREDVA